MSFVHLSLLAGVAVVTVPLMLHLFGQRQPQLIDFPALRFVRETSQEQSTSWQFRHLLLLLLRILLLAVMAFALARPRVHSAMLGSVIGISAVGVCAVLATLVAIAAWIGNRPRPVWIVSGVIALALWLVGGWWTYSSFTTGPSVPSADQTAPVAVAIVFDNGPTLAYRADNQQRIEAAKEVTTWLLEQLPLESRVGILSGVPVGSLSLDPSTAKSQVELIEVRGAHVDLLSRLRTAVDLVLANELERKEVYVVTDMSAPAWSVAQPGLEDLLTEHRDEVLVQIIDLGEERNANWQLSDPVVDYEQVPAGGDVQIEIEVSRGEQDGSANALATVELIQEAIDPNLPIVRNGQLQLATQSIVDRKAIDLTADEKQSVVLNARNLPEGTNHLIIRMDRQDPLALDNERYVSVLAAPPKPTLVVASDPDLAFMLRLIADPQSATDETKTQARSVNYAQLANVELSKYPVVCLLDPPPLSNRDAEALRKHVENGGGLLQLLGPSLGSPANVNNNAIESLLPGKDVGIIARDFNNRSGIFDAIAVSHPIFYTFGEIDPPWQNHPIFKSWTFGEMVDNAQVLAKATLDDAPLVISHPLGRGQVLTVCTPIPQPDVGGDAQWNELWIGDDPWPAFYLLSGMLHTLSGADRESLNYQVGTPVSLANAAQDWPRRWELFLPDAQSRRIESQDELLTITDLSQAGTYRMRGLRGDPKVRGFSINVPAADTMMQRVTEVDLDSQLGAGNYRIAVNRDELESSVGQSRFGRELYPLMMIFVAGLFLAEQAMSNRFYKINFSRTRKA